MDPNIGNWLPTLLAATAPAGGESSGTVSGLLLYISAAIGLSFLCSILEAVLLSTPPTYIESQVQEKGTRAARWMQKHKANVEDPITAILTLNTIAHTVGAAGAGAQAVGVFGDEFFGVISAVLTLLILVFSEIIPKTIGARYWKELNTFAAYTIQLMVTLLYPAVWLFRLMTQALTSEDTSPTVTRSELEMMAQISATEGTLEEKENRIFKNLLHLNGVQIYNIMTPRTVVFALQADLTVGEVLKEIRNIPYSRIPIYNDNIDDINGFVLRYDILKHAANDQDSVTLKEMVRPIHSVPETITVASALDEFMSRQHHIFLVFDEYGGTAGILTMEDAVESLLGVEITDESDLVADMRKLAEQRYTRQRALLQESSRVFPTNGGAFTPSDPSRSGGDLPMEGNPSFA